MPKKKTNEEPLADPIIEKADTLGGNDLPPETETISEAPLELSADELPGSDELGEDVLLLSDSDEDAPPPPPDGDIGDATVYRDLLHETDGNVPLTAESGLLPEDEVLAAGTESPVDIPSRKASSNDNETSDPVSKPQRRAARKAEAPEDYILTIDAHDRVETEEDRADLVWHELRNSLIGRKILTGTLDAAERTPSGATVAVVIYKGQRVVIPVKEMMLAPQNHTPGHRRYNNRDWYDKVLNTMMGAEIDFIVAGMDFQNRKVAASRKAAMLRKRQTFYFDENDRGQPMIYPGRVVQARVIGVAEKIIRVEVFGVECPIFARDVSSSWVGDIRDKYYVQDHLLVRVVSIHKESPQNISISVEMRSVSTATALDALESCLVQSKYVGRVTDVRKGVVYVRLNNGANAIAHTCLDRRMPGKKDDVSFVVTRIDRAQGVAVGLIPRILKQNL